MKGEEESEEKGKKLMNEENWIETTKVRKNLKKLMK